METAISNIMKDNIVKMFDKYRGDDDRIFINSVIPEEEQKKAENIEKD
jgi:hypothetical protein